MNSADSSAKTLQYDGTTKFGHKYGSFQLAKEEGSYTLGLNYQLSGSADHTLELMKACLDELTCAARKCGSDNSAGSLVLSKIRKKIL